MPKHSKIKRKLKKIGSSRCTFNDISSCLLERTPILSDNDSDRDNRILDKVRKLSNVPIIHNVKSKSTKPQPIVEFPPVQPSSPSKLIQVVQPIIKFPPEHLKLILHEQENNNAPPVNLDSSLDDTDEDILSMSDKKRLRLYGTSFGSTRWNAQPTVKPELSDEDCSTEDELFKPISYFPIQK